MNYSLKEETGEVFFVDIALWTDILIVSDDVHNLDKL